MLKELRRYPTPLNHSNELRMLESNDPILVSKAKNRIARKCNNDPKVMASIQTYLESK